MTYYPSKKNVQCTIFFMNLIIMKHMGYPTVGPEVQMSYTYTPSTGTGTHYSL